MNSTSPKSSLAKLGLHTKQRPIRIMVVGQSGVGKTGIIFLLHVCTKYFCYFVKYFFLLLFC